MEVRCVFFVVGGGALNIDYVSGFRGLRRSVRWPIVQLDTFRMQIDHVTVRAAVLGDWYFGLIISTTCTLWMEAQSLFFWSGTCNTFFCVVKLAVWVVKAFMSVCVFLVDLCNLFFLLICSTDNLIHFFTFLRIHSSIHPPTSTNLARTRLTRVRVCVFGHLSVYLFDHPSAGLFYGRCPFLPILVMWACRLYTYALITR
jgi:hypothetical protein